MYYFISLSLQRLETFLDEEINHQKIFDRATKFNTEKEEDPTISIFYRRRQGDCSKVMDVDEENQIFEEFLNQGLIKKFELKTDEEGEPLYYLVEGKMESCEIVAKKLPSKKWYIYRHFPSKILPANKKRKRCVDCVTREELIFEMDKVYDLVYDVHDTDNYICSEREIVENHVKVKNKQTGRYVNMNLQEKDNFREQQKLLQVLDSHYADKLAADSFWNYLLVLGNLDPNSFVVILDHMSTFELGKNVKSKSHAQRSRSAAEKIVPLGVVIVFKDHETNEIKRLHRFLMPDSTAITAWSVIKCLENLFDDDDDIVLQEVISNRSHCIVILFFFYE